MPCIYNHVHKIVTCKCCAIHDHNNYVCVCVLMHVCVFVCVCTCVATLLCIVLKECITLAIYSQTGLDYNNYYASH